ncbi:type II secretion system protein GspC [Thalassotalea ponticola]|uniref:type II secretion system protein GspC n=1 Tax=Thalassotalea ponticola TaxID=1523392 RepID=UPI0025B5B264|nr:type II secretion system protein GspC [Thalassotalea ponticola]MDN3652994.1 type II secretion system protein GspC [Thalassotalea ponticola]
MDLAQLHSQIQQVWQKLPMQALARALITTIVIYLAYWAATVTWLVIPEQVKPLPKSTQTSSNQLSSSSPTIDVSVIRDLNLFGKFVKPSEVKAPVKTVESAPETKLQLTLTGVVASTDDAVAAAIIESKGSQQTYGIDDKITGTRAVLKQVHPDRVIIETAGNMETLMLDGFKYTKQINANSTSSTARPQLDIKQTRNTKPPGPQPVKQQRIKEKIAELRADIAKDPTKITDYIKVSPHRVDGKIVGYRLMPSSKPEFFKQVGLVPGDVAVQINGRDLTDMREAQQALIELKVAEQIDILVDRQGELHDISLGLDN